MFRPIALTAVLSLALSLVSCRPQQDRPQVEFPPPETTGGSVDVGGPVDIKTVLAFGTATLAVAPDQARLLVVTETSGTDAAAAKAENTTNLTAILRIAKEAGLPASDISTGITVIEGVYTDSPAGPLYGGARVIDEVELTFNDLNKIEPLLLALLSPNVINRWSLSFTDTKAASHKKALLEDAVKNAKENATAMAAVLERVPGAPVSISEWRSDGGSVPIATNDSRISENSAGPGGPSGPGVEALAMAVSSLAKVRMEVKVDVVFQLVE